MCVIGYLLSEQEFQKRIQFCHWAQESTIYLRINILEYWKSKFIHYYADRNPRMIRPEDHQHRFKINVWAGICGEYIVGLYFLKKKENLNGNMYLQFLQTNFQIYLVLIFSAVILRTGYTRSLRQTLTI